MNILDLEFYNDIYRLNLAMMYSFSAYAQKYLDEENRKSWFKSIDENLRKDIYKKISKCLSDNAEELKDNALLKGLLETYVKCYNASNDEEYKDIYEEFQNLQKQYPFENNIKNYMECGCYVSTGESKVKDSLKLKYPVWFWTAYQEHGGSDYERHNGYFYPVQTLNKEEIEQIKNISEDYRLEVMDAVKKIEEAKNKELE